MQQSYQTAARAPLTASCATRTLALTTTNTNVTLPAGGYELVVTGATEAVVIGIGVTTAAKPDTTETAGIAVIPTNGVAEMVLDAETVLHARSLSGTATLNIVRKVVG